MFYELPLIHFYIATRNPLLVLVEMTLDIFGNNIVKDQSFHLVYLNMQTLLFIFYFDACADH